MDESILGDIPKREEVEAILKDMQDVIPIVSDDELKDPSKRRLAAERGREEGVLPSS
jgi:hypothetical protein